MNESRSDAGDAELIDRLYESGGDAELDGLRVVRGLVARVRDEMPGVEPPQAISARLLQAAALPARSAAVEPTREGPWARFRAWFAGVAMHPGMAAAATLVIVAGAAAIWMRQGGRAATPTVSTEPAAAEQDRDVEVPESPALPALTGSKDVAPVEAVTDDGDERDVRPADKSSTRKAPTPKPKPTTPARDDVSTGESSGSGSGGFADQTDKTTVTTKVGGKKTTGDAPVQAPPAPPPSEDPSPDSADEGGAPSDSEMARALTRQATAAAKKQDCESVEYFGKKVKALDPDYYATSFVTQRDIAACRPVSK